VGSVCPTVDVGIIGDRHGFAPSLTGQYVT
jgi:hypothetical protein